MQRNTPASAIDRAASQVVREALDQCGKTQARMAQVLGIAQGTVSRHLTGTHRWTLGELVVIGRWLGQDLLVAALERAESEPAQDLAS